MFCFVWMVGIYIALLLSWWPLKSLYSILAKGISAHEITELLVSLQPAVPPRPQPPTPECVCVASPQWSGAGFWPSLSLAICEWGSLEWWHQFDRMPSAALLSESANHNKDASGWGFEDRTTEKVWKIKLNQLNIRVQTSPSLQSYKSLFPGKSTGACGYLNLQFIKSSRGRKWT